MKIVLTNEIGNVIIVSGTSYLVAQNNICRYTEVALQMIGPTSATEWMMTKEEAFALRKVLDSVLST